MSHGGHACHARLTHSTGVVRFSLSCPSFHALITSGGRALPPAPSVPREASCGLSAHRLHSVCD